MGSPTTLGEPFPGLPPPLSSSLGVSRLTPPGLGPLPPLPPLPPSVSYRPPPFSLSSRAGRAAVFSPRSHRLPAARLAVLSSPVPAPSPPSVPAPSWDPAHLLAASPLHLAQRSPSRLLGARVSSSLSKRVLCASVLSPECLCPASGLRPLPSGSLFCPPVSRAGSPYLTLSPSLWASDPFSLGLSLPPCVCKLLPKPPSLWVCPHPWTPLPAASGGSEVALRVSHPSPSSQPNPWSRTGGGDGLAGDRAKSPTRAICPLPGHRPPPPPRPLGRQPELQAPRDARWTAGFQGPGRRPPSPSSRPQEWAAGGWTESAGCQPRTRTRGRGRWAAIEAGQGEGVGL